MKAIIGTTGATGKALVQQLLAANARGNLGEGATTSGQI